MKIILFFLFLSSINSNFINLKIKSLDELENIIKQKKEANSGKETLKDELEDEEDRDVCLASENDTIKIFKEKYNLDLQNKNITRYLRFIAGNCNPVILVPGVLSTALRVRIECQNLYDKERDVYKKLKFFCQLDDVCSNNTNYYDKSIFLNLYEEFGFIKPEVCDINNNCKNN